MVDVSWSPGLPLVSGFNGAALKYDSRQKSVAPAGCWPDQRLRRHEDAVVMVPPALTTVLLWISC